VIAGGVIVFKFSGSKEKKEVKQVQKTLKQYSVGR
jgi:hypothetical protein